ncbi:MAG: hypothetical protein LQ349_000536 [Xanthoria aureola]|nr:MAG: hypothetical protein LQ349_000536 [Xanthoria aureola]
MSYKAPWLALAAASGACAAFNGVFAKLTTTELTTSWSSAISSSLHLSSSNKFIEFIIRGTFFLLNLAFNALMWALFTAALTRASSTTRVSIINTSSNFLITALLGLMIFSEKLPPLWWVGAAGLVVGNVVIGRREEGDEDGDGRSRRQQQAAKGVRLEGDDGPVGEGYRDHHEGEGEEVDGDVLELDTDVEDEAQGVSARGDGGDERR